MRPTRAIRNLVGMVAAGTFVVACGGGAASTGGNSGGPPIKLAVIEPFHGPQAVYGEDLYRGNQMAVEEINAKGGVNGRKIELLKGDATDGAEGGQEVTRLATQENVDLFTGTYLSAVATTASDTANRYKKVYWDTNAVAQSLTDRGLPNFIRSGPAASNLAQGSVDAIVNQITQKLNKPAAQVKVYLEHEDGPYGTSVGDQQSAQLKAKGYQVVGNGAHPAASTDLTDSVLRASRATPDVLVFTGYVPDGSLYLKKMRETKFSPPATVLVGTGDTQDTLNALGAQYMEGILVVGYPRPDIMNPTYAPGGLAFLESYRKRFNQDPRAPQTISTYAGTKMLFEVIAKAGGTEPEKVRKAAATFDKAVGTYPNGFGMKFDEKFQNQRAEMVVVQWQSGKVVTVLPDKARMPGTQLVNLARPS